MAAFVNFNVKVPVWLDKICTWPVLVYRTHKYGWPFRRIDLGEGEFTIVDPLDYYRFGHFKLYLSGSKGKFYAVRSVKVDSTCTTVLRLHREIMNAPAGLLVDHHNGDSLDNRRDNLRIATACQNMQNRRVRKKHTASSQFIGVYFDKGRKDWIYQLRANGKLVSTGRFATEVEAARARDRAALKYHSEFARLNFKREDYKDLINALKQNEEKNNK